MRAILCTALLTLAATTAGVAQRGGSARPRTIVLISIRLGGGSWDGQPPGLDPIRVLAVTLITS
jgi:hypothetical protein